MGTGIRLSDRFKALGFLKAHPGQDSEKSVISYNNLLEVTLEVTIDLCKTGRGAKHRRKKKVPTSSLQKSSCHNVLSRGKKKPKPLQNVSNKSSKQKSKKRRAGSKHLLSKPLPRAGESKQIGGLSTVSLEDGVAHFSAKGTTAKVISLQEHTESTSTPLSCNIPSTWNSRPRDPRLISSNRSSISNASLDSASGLGSELQNQESSVIGVLVAEVDHPECLGRGITPNGNNTDDLNQNGEEASTEDVKTHTIDNAMNTSKTRESTEGLGCETFEEAFTMDNNNKRSDEILYTMPGKDVEYDAAETIEKGISIEESKSCAVNGNAEISEIAESEEKRAFAIDNDVKEKCDEIQCVKTAGAPAAVDEGLSEKGSAADAYKTEQLKEMSILTSGKDDVTPSDDSIMTKKGEEIFCSKSAQAMAHDAEDTIDEDNGSATGKMIEHSQMTGIFEITEENTVAMNTNVIESSADLSFLDTVRDATDDGREKSQEDIAVHDRRFCMMTETPARSQTIGKNSLAVDFSNIKKDNDQQQCERQNSMQRCTFPHVTIDEDCEHSTPNIMAENTKEPFKAFLRLMSTSPILEKCKQETEESCVSDKKPTIEEQCNVLYDSVKSDEIRDTVERSAQVRLTFSGEQSNDDVQQLQLTVISSPVEDQVSPCPLTQVAPDGLQIAVDSILSPPQLQTELGKVLSVGKKKLNPAKIDPIQDSVGNSDIYENIDGLTLGGISVPSQSCTGRNVAKGSGKFVDKTSINDSMAEMTNNTLIECSAVLHCQQYLQSHSGSVNTSTQSSRSPFIPVSTHVQTVPIMPDASHCEDDIQHFNTLETYGDLNGECSGREPPVHTSVSRVIEQLSSESDTISHTPKSTVGEDEELRKQHIPVLQQNCSISHESDRCVDNNMTESSQGDLRLHKYNQESKEYAGSSYQAKDDLGKLQLKTLEQSLRQELDNLDVIDMDISPSSSQGDWESCSDGRLKIASVNSSACPAPDKEDVCCIDIHSQESTGRKSPFLEEVVYEQQSCHETAQPSTAYSKEEMLCLPQDEENHAHGVPTSQVEGICEVKPSFNQRHMTGTSVDGKEIGFCENVGLSAFDDITNALAQTEAGPNIPIVLPTHFDNQQTNRHEEIPEKSEVSVCNAILHLSSVGSTKSSSDCTSISDTSHLGVTLPHGTDVQKMALLCNMNDQIYQTSTELSALCSDRNQQQPYVSNSAVNGEERVPSIYHANGFDTTQQKSDLSVPVSELVNKSKSYTKEEVMDCIEDYGQSSDHLGGQDDISVVKEEEYDVQKDESCDSLVVPESANKHVTYDKQDLLSRDNDSYKRQISGANSPTSSSQILQITTGFSEPILADSKVDATSRKHGMGQESANNLAACHNVQSTYRPMDEGCRKSGTVRPVFKKESSNVSDVKMGDEEDEIFTELKNEKLSQSLVVKGTNVPCWQVHNAVPGKGQVHDREGVDVDRFSSISDCQQMDPPFSPGREDVLKGKGFVSAMDRDEMGSHYMRKCHIQKLPHLGVIPKHFPLPDQWQCSENQTVLMNSEKVAAVQAIQFQISTAVNPTHRAALELALEALMTSVMRHPNDNVCNEGKTNISRRAQRSSKGQNLEKSAPASTQIAKLCEAKSDTGEENSHSICAMKNDTYQTGVSAPPDNSEVTTAMRSHKADEEHVDHWLTSKKPKRSIKYFHGRPLIKDRSNATDPCPIPLHSNDDVSSIDDPRIFVTQDPKRGKELKRLKWRSSRSRKRKGRHSKNVAQKDKSRKDKQRRRINESEGITQDTGWEKHVMSYSVSHKQLTGPTQDSHKSVNHKLQTLHASVSAGSLASDDANGSHHDHVIRKEDCGNVHSKHIVKEGAGMNQDTLSGEGAQISDMRNGTCMTGELVEVILGKRTRAEENTRSKSPRYRSQSNDSTSWSDESRRESKMKHHFQESSDESTEPPRKVRRWEPNSRFSRRHWRSKYTPFTHTHGSHVVMFDKRGTMCSGSLEKPFSSPMYVRSTGRGRDRNRLKRTYVHHNLLRKDRFHDLKSDEPKSLSKSVEELGFPTIVPWTVLHAALHDIKSEMLSMEKSPKEVNKAKAMQLIHPLLKIRDATIPALKRINAAVCGMKSKTKSELHLHRQKYEILVADIRVHAEVLSNLLAPDEAKKVMAGFVDNATGIPFVDSTIELHVLKCLRHRGFSAMCSACLDLIESKLNKLQGSKTNSWRSKSFSDIDDSHYPLSPDTIRHVDGSNGRSETTRIDVHTVNAASPTSVSGPELVTTTPATPVTESFDESWSELRLASDSKAHETWKLRDLPSGIFQDPPKPCRKFSSSTDHVSGHMALDDVSCVEGCTGDTKKTLTASESTRNGDLCDTFCKVPDISMYCNTIPASLPHNPDSSLKARVQGLDFQSRLSSDSDVDDQKLMCNDYQRNSKGLWTPRSPVGSSDSSSQTKPKRVKSRCKSPWFKTGLKKQSFSNLSMMYDEYDESCTTSRD